MKNGVFLCTCSGTIDLDFRKLKKDITADVVETYNMLCHNDGLASLRESVKTNELGQVLVACTSRKKIFDPLGLELEFINIREHCGWVHEKKYATEKARILVNAALEYPVQTGKITFDVGKDVLITGEIIAAQKVAKYISKFGNVHIVFEQPSLEPESGISVHVGNVRDIGGRIGDFRVSIAGNLIDKEKCISCGKCLDACPIHAIYEYPVFSTGKECDKCGKCIHVCPADAISIRDEIKTIKVGQILVIGDENKKIITQKKGIFVTKKGESDVDNFRNALPEALEIISNMGGIRQEKLLSVSTKGCASGKSGFKGCSLCESVCPSDTITRNGDSIVFNEISCVGCCACASVCPLSHVQLKQDIYPRMEFLLNSSRLSPNILMLACSHSLPVLEAAGRKKMKYPPILPLFVPCTAGVSEVHILRAFDLGADGVIIMGCSDCLSKSNSAWELAGLILRDCGLDGRICVINSGDTDSFVGSITVFSKCLVPSPLKEQESAKMEKTGKRQNMLNLLRGIAAKTGIIPGLVVYDKEYPFAAISISKKCTVCGACTAMCPTGALNREDGSILFTYPECIACGLCEKACPESAIKTHNVLDLAKLVEGAQETLIRTQMHECSACKRPYMTEAAFDRITGSLIMNVRNDLKPHEQVELINGQVELLKFCEQCRPVRAISKLEMFS